MTGWGQLFKDMQQGDLVSSATKLTFKHCRVVSSETSPTSFLEGKGDEVRAFSNRQYNSLKVTL